VILAPAARAFVAQFVDGGGATSTVVPVAAQSGSGRRDEPPLVALLAPGLGSIPEELGTTPSGVVRVRGQAQSTDWEAGRGCAGWKSLVLGRRILVQRAAIWRRGGTGVSGGARVTAYRRA